jgi:hypothetical protein
LELGSCLVSTPSKVLQCGQQGINAAGAEVKGFDEDFNQPTQTLAFHAVSQVDSMPPRAIVATPQGAAALYPIVISMSERRGIIIYYIPIRKVHLAHTQMSIFVTSRGHKRVA